MGRSLLSTALSVASASLYVLHAAAQNPAPGFLPQSFFFDWNPPGVTIPIPTTQQCDVLPISWERTSAGVGPNPIPPYFLEVYTSAFTAPLVVPAGAGSSFNFTVPFAPGTQYQICMFDSNGATGGCQDIYTVIPNANTSITCANATYPATTMHVDAEVSTGPLSQFAWINQCTDITVTPKNGTPPYIYTIAPALHPPLNMTETTAGSMTWKVSLSWGFPFFVGVVDSQGNGWAYGPLHSGDGTDTSCLDLNGGGGKKKSSAAIEAGAAVGGLVVGILVGALGLWTFFRYRSPRDAPTSAKLSRKGSTFGESNDYFQQHQVTQQAPLSPRPITHNQGDAASAHYIVEPFNLPSPPSHEQSALLPNDGPGAAPRANTVASGSSTGPTEAGSAGGAANVYVIHHDGGQAPVTVMTDNPTNIVELPPRYGDGPSSSRQQAGDGSRKARGPR